MAVVTTVCLTAAAKAEEAENTRYFGAAYGEYMKKTKMFIPLCFERMMVRTSSLVRDRR